MIKRSFAIILIAETISAMGSQVTIVALPLAAVLLLHASPLQMGLLTSAGFLPNVLFGLFAGVMIDRLPKRRILILTNLFSAVTLAIVPIGEATQFLSISLLIIVSFAAAVLSGAEGLALLSFLPSIVEENRLAEANGRFSAAVSVARVVGPAAAGGLIAAFNASGAIAIDAISFLVATLLIVEIPDRIPEQQSMQAPIFRASMFMDLKDGLRFMFKDKTLSMVVMIAAPFNFFSAAFNSLQALFIVRHLGVKPSLFGLALAAAGITAIFGALIVGRISRSLDLPKLLSLAMVMFLIADGNVCLLQGPPLVAALRFGASSAIEGFASTVVIVAIMTYIQKAAPAEMLARVNGVLMTTFGAATPLGALAGGACGSIIGVRQTMIIATLGYVIILIVLLRVPRRTIPIVTRKF
jgi:MFS family permease